jgi:TRAP-type C4-dicarboxylate transport system substrate-binding protein
MYQVEADTSGQISYAIYPSGAYTAATLEATIQALGNVQITASNGTVTGVNVSSSEVTDVGFKLA